MKAAILRGPGRFIVEDRPKPVISDNGILIKTKACGICTSELSMWEGKNPDLEFPRFIGHEVSGVVSGVGKKVTSIKVDDHVAVWIESQGYAEYVVSNESYIYGLRNETSLEHALGEPIACAVNGVRKVNPQLNESVCIVGCGFMGLIMLQIFKMRGVGLLIALDTRDSILDLSRTLGATHTFNPNRTDVKTAVHDLTHGQGVDIGVEAAGKQETLDLTMELVRMEGKLEIFGYHQGEHRNVNMGYWNWMAFQIINGHSRSPQIYLEGMRIGLELLEANKLIMAKLITHRFTLEQINQGFEIAVRKPEGFIKGIITF